MQMNRRSAIQTLGISLAGLHTLPAWTGLFTQNDPRFQIGACDWSIGQHSMVTALEVAAGLGLDGIQASLVNRNNDPHFKMDFVKKLYREQAGKTGVRLGGFALGQMNQVPFKSDPITLQWVRDGIDIAHEMGVKVILLAFFGEGDIKEDPEGRKEVIRRLKGLVPYAEDKGIILGIESWLSAREHMDIIEAVGSDHIQVYYDVANSHKMGYDIYEEIQWLGKEQICEFHMKENGYLLGQGKIDFDRLRTVIDEIEYQGWVVIEGALPEGQSVSEAYPHNVAFMKKWIQK